MSRRKKGDAVNGWVVLDKPAGMTSTQAVGAVRRAFNAQKAGHAGTLDPLATGILPIALGEATKTVPFAVDGEKEYRFTVRWGVETNTDDAEGVAVASSDERPARAAVEALLASFTGEIMQAPPAFSAIKIDGERAYDLARDGEVVVIAPRPVVIDALSVVDMPDAATTVFEARCGKGTYVRALARDMGRVLGCFGHIIALRRTRVGQFGEDRAVALDTLRGVTVGDVGADGPPPHIETFGKLSSSEAGASTRFLLPVEAALGDLLEISVSPSDAADLALGRAILIRGRDAPILSGPAYAIARGRIVALGEIEKGALHPTRVFNLG
ncbi:MAG: tRNA pseudouridine(55) synthase TruB [Hyphomicrobium sp.]